MIKLLVTSTGIGGRTFLGMVFRGVRAAIQTKLGKNTDHPHLKAANNPNFGDALIKQALINDGIEGEEGSYGAKNYLESKDKKQKNDKQNGG